MEVTNPEAPWPQGDPDRIRPSLRTADGTDHPTTPYSSLSATDIWITDNFWRYTKDTRTVELPNGWTARYSSDTGRAMLEEVTDTYGNRITVDWEYPHEALRPRPTAFTQHLASGIRQIAFTYDNSSRLTPETMTFAGRTWTYAYGPDWPHLTSVTLPEGAPWQFDYSNGLLVTTPHGGTVRYEFEPQTFPDGAAWPLDVVRSRTTGGRAVEAGTWQFTYAPQTASQNGSFGTAAGPQGLSIEFRHDWAQFTSRWVLTRKSIREPGQELAVLDRSYTNLSKVPWGSATIPVPHQDTITRDGVAHQITYDYRQNHEGEFFGDFHRPFRTTETGPLSRQTVVEYDYDFAFYVAGPLKRETVTVDGESFTSSFDHEDSTGFRTSQTIYGITTTFGRDGSGNPASATDANGHTTTTTYEWGVAKDTTTPEYGIARSIDHDGTVRSEIRGEITRTFD
jgi:YD repeat-containing protein